MKINVLTLFPEMFTAVTESSILGKAAEKGCIGCPWYDIARWREELNNIIAERNKE